MGNKLNIKKTDIRDKTQFNFEDDTLKFLVYHGPDDGTGTYLYGRYHRTDCRKESVGKLYGFEVVRPVKRKQPDGSLVLCYPSSEQFGLYGWFHGLLSKQEIESKFPEIIGTGYEMLK